MQSLAICSISLSNVALVHRSFNLLDDALEASLDGDEVAAGKVSDRMTAVRDCMDRFDRSIRSCLHMA